VKMVVRGKIAKEQEEARKRAGRDWTGKTGWDGSDGDCGMAAGAAPLLQKRQPLNTPTKIHDPSKRTAGQQRKAQASKHTHFEQSAATTYEPPDCH